MTTSSAIGSGTTTTTSAATSASAGSADSSTALSSLSGNFQDFLKMLMTQLQNQDPTSPMDTNQFTSQLVQFASVEQQINANSNLTQLIQLTQSGQMIQSSSLVGHTVEVTSDHLTLQKGTANLKFTASAAGPVNIAITTDAGVKLADATVNASKGSNSWSWNGTSSSGATLPDGSYKVTVTSTGSAGTTTSVPFTVLGTATGVVKNGTGLTLDMGSLDVDFSAVKSVVN